METKVGHQGRKVLKGFPDQELCCPPGEHQSRSARGSWKGA